MLWPGRQSRHIWILFASILVHSSHISKILKKKEPSAKASPDYLANRSSHKFGHLAKISGHGCQSIRPVPATTCPTLVSTALVSAISSWLLQELLLCLIKVSGHLPPQPVRIDSNFPLILLATSIQRLQPPQAATSREQPLENIHTKHIFKQLLTSDSIHPSIKQLGIMVTSSIPYQRLLQLLATTGCNSSSQNSIRTVTAMIPHVSPRPPMPGPSCGLTWSSKPCSPSRHLNISRKTKVTLCQTCLSCNQPC